jgi:4-amino-4-deoxy-L-arabinose transferase-like glycosyltransferase
MKRERSAQWTTFLLFAVLLGAFALWIGWLDRLPLWWDEGLSAHLSPYPPLALLEEMQATDHADPPAYQFALSGWRAIVGPTPFSLRAFSALMSTLSVALTWAVGRWLTSRRTALLAALRDGTRPVPDTGWAVPSVRRNPSPG